MSSIGGRFGQKPARESPMHRPHESFLEIIGPGSGKRFEHPDETRCFQPRNDPLRRRPPTIDSACAPVPAPPQDQDPARWFRPAPGYSGSCPGFQSCPWPHRGPWRGIDSGRVAPGEPREIPEDEAALQRDGQEREPAPVIEAQRHARLTEHPSPWVATRRTGIAAPRVEIATNRPRAPRRRRVRERLRGV